ncbi:MAG: aspartate/tyrosine/aromatic aminotransferase [Sinobacteraceae bacterium]|nr:aspartate/tyrosine/aromatic aminotransferase [Nevskiaceae bacterium]
MFERLDSLPTDPILGLMAAYRADSDPAKVDLGVGVYRDARGETPVLACVRRAEQAVLARQTTKTYVAAAGNAGFNQAMAQLVLGEGHPIFGTNRLRCIQSVGGCGALRLGAELMRRADPPAIVHVSTPTWANHVPLLSGCGLKLERYPYYDSRTGGVLFEEMKAALMRLPARAIVLLHASCHNPTGADLSEAQWRELLPVFRQRELLPFIDLAYQGLGSGSAEDAFGARLFCAELPEVAVAVSCSKNFGLYRERTGCLLVVTQTPAAADAALSQLVQIARSLYSMPPDHGAAIVHEILGDAALRTQWQEEVGAMRERINGLRAALVSELARSCPQRDFGFIARQRGMFSWLGVDVSQVRALRERHHIFMLDDSRINLAGLSTGNIPYCAQAIAQVLR